MNPSEEFPGTVWIDCRLGCKLTLTACNKRQLSHPRYSKPDNGNLNSMFVCCRACDNWLSDSRYEANASDYNKFKFGSRGKSARKLRSDQDRSKRTAKAKPNIRHYIPADIR